MPVSKCNVPQQKDINKWPYLQNVKLHDIDAEVELLIGTDAAKVMEPWELINSQGEGPYAVRTRVGWVINGPLRCEDRDTIGCSAITVNRISVEHLENMLIQQYNHDFNEKTSQEQKEMSREDIKFMDIMNNTAVLIDGHYCIELPFKEQNVSLPQNRCMAEQRLQSLKIKFHKNGSFKEEYITFVENMICDGYAELVPADQLIANDGKVWFIPHHGVYHPRKHKLRVVFDCTVTYKGTSLNFQLLQGPDLTNSVVGVLLRFRQEPVAVMADIQAMYHQVQVPEHQRNFLRFLWWPKGDTSQAPKEYRMKVHLFGAVSSPSCANYALRRTAEDNTQHFSPEVVNTIKHNFYVDDCLKSLSTEEAAIKMVQDLTALCSKGGFKLSKWLSNSRAVLNTVSNNNKAKKILELDLVEDELPMERALGLQWCTERDTFEFKSSLPEQPHTRRGILSVVSSLYDPLGFLAPFTITAKLLLQELCRRNLGWDHAVHPHFSKQWSSWLQDLKKIAEFRVDRCIKPTDTSPVTLQLHHFSDASQVGYGTVSYLRIQSDYYVHLSFLLGKARVAPLKQTTIPRLELTAAVLAVRIDNMLQKKLHLKLEKSVFWTDSTTVLKYISNETKRFHTFVANRVSLIREATHVDQWRYVSTKDNPADEATRGMRAEDFMEHSRWIKGPQFLFEHKDKWPKLDENSDSVPADDPEVKKDITVSVVIQEMKSPTSFLLTSCSSWVKLKKNVACFLKVKELLKVLSQKRAEFSQQPECAKQKMQHFKTTVKGQCLTCDDLAKAEQAIIQFEQHQRFKTEIGQLRANKNIFKESNLYRLDPVLYNGLLRVGGRLHKADLPLDSKHPVILSKDMHVSTLILRQIHHQLGHAGRNHMLSRLRQKYWILSANSAARKIMSECITCRRNRGKLMEQKMADLPLERVTPDKASFTDVGVDYFGPIDVKRGRSLLKRYRVIFTCLTSRAVHLEVAHTLDADSCINAVRRFVCRRGPVSSIRSDNGTNFVGANRELKESLADLNQNKIQKTLVHDGINWKFNTPAASHQGGVWERLIRSVRNVLTSVLKQQIVDDEVLQTVFCEAEAILNDRPLTPVSDDPSDLEALTPNHILTLKGKPIMPAGLFQKQDLYLKKRWRQVQYMAEVFWKRWISEYLPIMQERQRWMRPRRNICPGDIVLIADAAAPRGCWQMGRVLAVNTDSRGLVRSVQLKTKTSVLERPVTKLCLLLEAAMD